MVIGARGAVCLGKVVPGLLDLAVDLVVLQAVGIKEDFGGVTEST